MKQRIKTVSRVTQLIAHQKEALEMRVLQTRNLLAKESHRLAGLNNELKEAFDDFDERVMGQKRVTAWDVAFLYGIHATLRGRIEKKNKEVDLINETLKAQKALVLEAYQKKKIFEGFKNNLIRQEKRESDLKEQKAMDFFSLTKGFKK